MVLIFQFFPVADIIAVGLPVATDFDVESFLNFFFVLLESPFGISPSF